MFLNNFVGNSSIPSLIGKSSWVNFSAVVFCASVISFVVAFCVSVTGLNNLVNPVCYSASPTFRAIKLSLILFLVSIKSLINSSRFLGSLTFINDISF